MTYIRDDRDEHYGHIKPQSTRAWTRQEATELDCRLRGKTIERVEYLDGGIINIVTTDCHVLIAQPESGPVEEEK